MVPLLRLIYLYAQYASWHARGERTPPIGGSVAMSSTSLHAAKVLIEKAW